MSSLLRVAARGLNLRERPDLKAPILRELPRHTAIVREVGGRDGFIPVRTLDCTEKGWVFAAHTAPDPAPWLTVAREEMKAGVAELVGAKHTARIVEYHGTTTLKATADEVPWCSAFANWCTLQTGIMGTRLANARSWLKWGKELKEPVLGCIVVLTRSADPASGHVAFFLREAAGKVYLLGGNQGNRISEAPYLKTRVLSYRWPTDAPLPAEYAKVG